MRRYTEKRAAKDWERVLDAIRLNDAAPPRTVWVRGVLCHKRKRRYGHVAVMSDSSVAMRILHWLRDLTAYDRLRAEMDEELLFFHKRGGI